MVRIILKNLTAVLRDRIAYNVTVIIENGIISEIDESNKYTNGLDCEGLYCLPGIIDTHSDILENELLQRSNIDFPPEFIMNSIENRLLSSGITTICHGITFEDCSFRKRSVHNAKKLVHIIDVFNETGLTQLDHIILYRLNVRSSNAITYIKDRLDYCKNNGSKIFIGIEDHAPGFGPFHEINKFRQHLVNMIGVDDDFVDTLLDDEIKKTEMYSPQKNRCELFIPEIIKHGAKILAHDCYDAEEVHNTYSIGASVAEFPLSLDAARTAKKLGMLVVAGAPNIIRGKSHSGFVSAFDLVKNRVCDILASDYMPQSLLVAAFKMYFDGELPLHVAIQLISSGPANLLGLTDRGEIKVGFRGDLILVSLNQQIPKIIHTFTYPSFHKDFLVINYGDK